MLLAGGAQLSLWMESSLSPSIFRCSWTGQPRQCSCSCYLSPPHLTSPHRSSTTLIIFFPPLRCASIGPLSDDSQHEAPISTPTLHVGHLLLAVSSCANLLRVRSGSHTVHLASKPLPQLACSLCAPSTHLFFSPSRQIIARRSWRVRGSFRCDLMLISTLFFSFVFNLYFTIFHMPLVLLASSATVFFSCLFASVAIFRGTEHEAEFSAALRTKADALLLKCSPSASYIYRPSFYLRREDG